MSTEDVGNEHQRPHTTSLPPAETVATLARSASVTSTDISRRPLTNSLAVFSIPRVSWMGLVPAATIFMPSAIIAALRMVAVVVPSPAVSLVLDAACIGRNLKRLAHCKELVQTHKALI